eukprot:gb/GECG01002947.1/.p1 GENE.gb/GECG01002947.1/~~gb/GECG01002947.1/.p1  ORF type:complete len:248 (+),score=29.58 gb/GECG01002947.1/:1-744(+)
MAAVSKTIVEQLASELQLPVKNVTATVNLLEEEKTVPFIVRYRKEITGGLEQPMLRRIQHRLEELKELQSRKATVIRQIEKTHPDILRTDDPNLRRRIESATSLEEIEDLYLPYKPKKAGTLAERARALGSAVQHLADALWTARIERDESASRNVSTFPTLLKTAMDKLGKSREDLKIAIQHILAEKLSELPEARQNMRAWLMKSGVLCTFFHISRESSCSIHEVKETCCRASGQCKINLGGRRKAV